MVGSHAFPWRKEASPRDRRRPLLGVMCCHRSPVTLAPRGIIAEMLTYAGQFKPLKLFTIDRNFGSWSRAQQVHFADGGVFDQIMTGIGRGR